MFLIESGGGGATALDGLSDVTITTPATGHVLNYNGSTWVNSTPGSVSAPATIYVATTGSDTTGDGTSGLPYASVGKALSVLPKTIDSVYTIDVADGTYTGSTNGIIEVDDFVCTGEGKIIVTGDTTTPANVSFTGSATQGSSTYTWYVAGPVVVEFEGMRVNATADGGLGGANGAKVIVDRSTITGTLGTGIALGNTRLEFQGNCTISGWSTRGIGAFHGCEIMYTSAGTLTITGPGSTGIGIHMGYGTRFPITVGSGLNITITGVLAGFHLGLHSHFQHIGTSSTVTVDNVTTPSNSYAIQCTDLSDFAVTCALVLDHFTTGIVLNSISYCEASGSRTYTFLGATSSVTQNSIYYAP
jgi:hypothetical protein